MGGEFVRQKDWEVAMFAKTNSTSPGVALIVVGASMLFIDSSAVKKFQTPLLLLGVLGFLLIGGILGLKGYQGIKKGGISETETLFHVLAVLLCGLCCSTGLALGIVGFQMLPDSGVVILFVGVLCGFCASKKIRLL